MKTIAHFTQWAKYTAISSWMNASEEEPNFTGPGRDAALKAPAGIPASQLQGPQRELLESLVDEYLENMHPQVARSHRNKVQEDGFDALHFAWMDPALLGRPSLAKAPGPPPLAAALTGMTADQAKLTIEDTIVGALQYMAPEQLGRERGRRAHGYFRAGEVIYEMADGQTSVYREA